MSVAEQVEELRPGAFAIAYRMLGSVSEAEDVVQESLLRLHQALEGDEEIASPRAYLSTIVTRLAIDELRSARARREVYVGEWLPEPLLTSGEDDPAAQAEIADSLSVGFLVLLESLSPEQRAAFLLREVFDYPYDRIAEIIGKAEPATRQLVSRARRHVDERRPRFETSREQADRLAESFFAAVEEGDLDGLESLLGEDVVVHGDGGGKAPAMARPVSGRSRVARMLTNWVRVSARMGARLRRVEVNGAAGAEYVDSEGRVIGVMSIEVGGGRIQTVRSVVNPDKLGHLGPLADVNALLRGLRGRESDD